jgi:DNA-binding GntR family transcriptional regulator
MYPKVFRDTTAVHTLRTLYPPVRSTPVKSDNSISVQGTVADRVYSLLRDRIARGELERGARLHQEDLAVELGVSRTPVREALRRLSAEGLVELLTNRGARVATADDDDVRAAYSTRLIIEPGAARIAAKVAGHAAIEEMRAIIARSKPGKRIGAAQLFEINREFHLALVAAAGNRQVTEFMEHVWLARIGSQLYVAAPDRAILSDDWRAHSDIVDAIGTGRAAKAESLTRAHIQRALDLLAAR